MSEVLGKYGMLIPVYDSLADDAGALAGLVAVAPNMWRAEVERAGGRPDGEPTVEQHENREYGWQIDIDEDGEPIIDHVKLYIRVVGPAWHA